MDKQLIGGTLMVVGTAIGGGMLALPLANAETGFLSSTLLLIICWLIMTASALLILEVNLWLPPHSNIISMAKTTLGKPGEIVAWVTYLLLLYSLLSAYIASGGDFLTNLIGNLHITLPDWGGSLLFVFILGYVVYRGILSVVVVNRYLMFTKLGVYLILVLSILPFISLHKVISGDVRYFTSSVTVAITSFGFANIVPSLRTYFNNDAYKLRRAVVVGSMIPLVCYILWDLAIMGIIPRTGDNGLIAMVHSGHSTSDFVTELSALLQRPTISLLAHIFTAICLATSFLGVAISLTDFLADGLNIIKKGRDHCLILGLTFLPPLLIVLFYPGAFIAALSYAGIDCMVLLVFLPALMAWRGRYNKNLTTTTGMSYRLPGGKIMLLVLMLAAVLIVLQGISENIH